MSMPESNIEVLRKETYLKAIENSVGSKLFNSLFVRFKDSGKVVDILNNGEFSCAFFVSAILTLLQVLDRPHSTVKKLKELFDSDKNWHKVDISNIQAGDVVFYKKVKFKDGTENVHVGFVLNEQEAVSADYKKKKIVKHKLNKRPIEEIYRYSWPAVS
jgi:hypothetical protein